MVRAFRAFVKKAGIPPVRFHDLRHTHATLLLKQGVHLKVVSERLGHSTIGITLDIYSHVMPTMQQEAVKEFERLFS
ncbi:site-specific integrase [Alicyclobacillus macrosporangiidus]|uniref:site-specific integrase n=1 Tax=Alicyclobacillus macrosporangiidus TaxID=392015 RepID=UPI0026E9B9DA|nr:site-specific integrase [Alicyclobacillus macrosporangiidus]